MTSLIPLLLKELDEEAAITRKMLQIVPDGKYDWKPHTKSMSIKQLASHIAELPGWVVMVLNTSELDFETNPYQPEDINNTADLLSFFEKTLADSKAHLEKAREEQLNDMWTLRSGQNIYSVRTKYEVIRMTYAQIIHHRAQMGVNLRLLDIPIPGSYGPSADEQMK